MKKYTFILFTSLLFTMSFLGCSNSENSNKNNAETFLIDQKRNTDLFNFRINGDEPTKIYFDSKKKITSIITDKFLIKDHDGITVLSNHVNESSTKDHFLIVEKPFSWYQNNTISYLGDDETQAFKLKFIENNIPIPTATGKQYFINASIENSGDGLSEEKAFKTIQEGIDVLTSGDKLWIKSGNYGNENVVVRNSGNTTNPIQIEGYIKTIGDISFMYYTYGNGALDAEMMPLLDGGNRAKGTGFMIDDNVHHIVVKNIQITNYHKGFFGRVNTGKVRLERILVKDMGDWGNGGKEGSGILLETWDNNKCNYYKVKDCIVINAEERGITSMGDNNYYENCKVYSDEFDLNPDDYMKKATDYYFRIQGIGNIIRGCEAHKKIKLGHYGHGFSMKYFNEFNLVENCEAVNILWAYQARHSVCRFNVFRNSVAHADVSYRRREQYSSYSGGINVMSGANNNMFENIYIHDTDLAFDFYKNSEDNENSTGIAHDNIFKNIKIENIVHTVIKIKNYESVIASFNNNKFDNLNINRVNFQEAPVKEFEHDKGAIQGGFFEWNLNGKITAKGNEIKNSTLKNIPFLTISKKDPLPFGFILIDNKFENTFAVPSSIEKN